MNAIDKISDSDRYARCIQTSKRVRWEIDEDVIRGRRFDAAHKSLLDGLSLLASTLFWAGHDVLVASLLSERDSARGAIEQPDADALLEPRNRAAHTGLGDSKRCRRAREASSFDSGDQNLNPTQQPAIERHRAA